MLGLLVFLAFPAAIVHAALPAKCDRNATIVSGDTCNGISAKHNVSTYQLATVNTGIIDPGCDNLQVGEVICLGLTHQDCNTTYVVQPGDTCICITDAFKIPQKTLFQNNPNVNQACTNLYPSEVLCVSGTIYVNSTQQA